ncbi:MAG: hypothetical protein PHD97_12920 [Bacteroidales bacterium]|nr:hypothetical protein [Bacteroidales bacterium]
MRLANTIFLIFIFSFSFISLHCLCQNTNNEKNIIVLTKKKKPLSKPKFLTRNQKITYKAVFNHFKNASGRITNITNDSIEINLLKINYNQFKSINNLTLTERVRRIGSIVTFAAGAGFIFFAPISVPLGLLLYKTKGDNFDLINKWNYHVINTNEYLKNNTHSESKIKKADTISFVKRLVIKDYRKRRNKLPYLNDSAWKNTFYIYPLNSINELSLGYERRIISRLGIEGSYGIIYSWKNYYFTDALPNNYKNPFISNGYSFKFRIKYYYNCRNYIGLNFLYKYFYFDKKTTYSFEHYNYSVVMSEQSASNRVLGFSVNFGYWLTFKHFVFDIYSGIGLKNIDGKITTYSYKFKGGGSYHYDYNPPQIESTRYAHHELYGPNGRMLYPSIQLGIKIGYCFK